jgi:hypothetical protein
MFSRTQAVQMYLYVRVPRHMTMVTLQRSVVEYALPGVRVRRMFMDRFCTSLFFFQVRAMVVF